MEMKWQGIFLPVNTDNQKHFLMPVRQWETLPGADGTEGRDVTQRDLDKLRRSVLLNLMRFNMAKCKALHLDQSNPRYVYRLGELLGSNPVEKDLGVG